MNNASQKGCNLLCLGDEAIHRLGKDEKALKSALEQLKSENGSLANCVLYNITNSSAIEIFMMLEAIDSCISDIDEPAIATELSLMKDELEQLLAENSRLEKEFQPYLFCPALERPEKCN